jgi:hypothetical protein
MTVTSAFATITDSISNLDITGVSIRDIDQIPDSAMGLTPLLIPQPNDFVTEYDAEFVSFGSNGTAKIDLKYKLNYVYLHAEVGSGVSTYEIYAGLIANLSAILVAILSNDAITGLIDMKPKIGRIGPIEDPSGNQFWGVLFSFPILEYAQ